MAALLSCDCGGRFFGQARRDDTMAVLCTPEELVRVNQIRAAVAVHWTAEDVDHVKLLLQTWKLAFPRCSVVSDDDLNSNDMERLNAVFQKVAWKDLGFQHTDPTTDIRGSRLLGVKHLASFSEQYGEEMRSMLNAEHHLFPFAACSFNVTYALIYHLRLNTKSEGVFISPYGGLEQPRFQITDGARRSDYLGFLGLLPLLRGKHPESLLCILHAYALIAVVRQWKTAWKTAKKNSGMTPDEYFLMNFNREILPAAWQHVETLLIQRPHTLAELDFNHRQVFS